MIRKTISLIALLSISALSLSAKVSKTIPAVLQEGKVLNLSGTNFNSDSLPLAASLKTVDGTTITLDTTVVSANQFKVKIPTVSADTKAALRISGGNVTAAKPQEYLVLILDEPAAAFITPLNGDDMVALPSTVTASTQAATVTVASQPNITSLTGATTIGALGRTTVFPGAINVASGITGTVSTPSQASITTLAGLTSAGATGVNTQFLGTVQAVQGFTGNVTGNITGTVTGNVTATTVTATTVIATTFNGTAESAVAGVTDIATAKEISDADTVTISSATLIKVTDADNDDDLALIAGGRTGQYLTIIFDDAITVIDDDVATATNAIDVVDAAEDGEAFGIGDILTLVFDGTAWHEVSRSINATGD